MKFEAKNAYLKTSEEVLNALNVDKNKGLSSAEAKARLEQYGANELQTEEKISTLQKFINQFKDFMIIVLLVAAIISWTISGEFADAVVILIVVILNAVMGVFQENKAEEAINALRQMASPEAQVVRDGQIKIIKSGEIVPGDIVHFEAGDVVSADIRLVEANSLKIEEAALTGESVPVEKDVAVIKEEVGIGDRRNMAYSSTNVTYGRAVGVVTATAMATEVGHIARMLATTEAQKTPLQRDQDELGKKLTYAIIIIAIATFLVGTFVQGIAWTKMLLVAVSLAVAAIPEGLPAISTIILSIGTQNMSKRNALIRSLPAVETLGSTQVICSDKTGTLTLNQMTVEQSYYDGQVHSAADGVAQDSHLMRTLTFANDTKIDKDDGLVGDPTETSLIQFALDHHYDLQQALDEMPRVGELPFDSERKLMSTIHKMADGRYFVAVKGAPDQLINRVSQKEENGQISEFTAQDRQHVSQVNTDFAKQALRVLAAAYKIIDHLPESLTTETIENDLVFAGLVAMIDPERPEARDSINEARKAGIRTIMITGDHAVTAQAIAERLTILNPTDEHNEMHVMTGAQLDEMSDEDLAQNIAQYSVYARVSPEHKVRIIKAWQANGKVVSMTGDGVNDAPSLKQADIGVGMGITGTEVSKGASDMILADDNFATIVHAVEEGRKVFSNIQKVVQYLLSANLGEVLVLFIATLLGWQILEPIHILWINLVTDVFPAIALGMENGDKDAMEYAPRDVDESFLSNGILPSIIYQGIFEAALTLFVYWFARYQFAPQYYADQAHIINLAETMAFMTLGLIQLFHAFNMKSVFQSLFSINPFANRHLNLAAVGSGALLLGVVLTPGVNQFFDITMPDIKGWAIIVVSAFSITIFTEVVKWLLRALNIDKKYQKRAVIKN
ncbi:cation-translocating P-type ATPase [Allofustis seminis]|uniref:cation-translocating P-type ATPase n=1 Tax=Allofustis seminis TaxID=166939 RepID=UPI000370253B|nr:cation-translocating P-type ATPase [Allofustis seminis]